ncbi:alpha/beta hydrolase [Halalkalibacter krulwichiae]|uniref:Phospholipase YtpA n=1 Tax=Halalkalibacter krulwichiae TaxID=199441 RepID=A0A1X9MHB0_9BACI|nr:alpha/beta hydrolase [Halalkalibacter krulwichiae]ARK30891.1 Phospholipase YtpA [Halalkalibacter krulwichiae]
MKRESWIPLSDGHEVYLWSWQDETIAPKAIIQLAHGMAEHSERYQRTAEQLAACKMIVYAHDHRGHGRTVERNGLLGHLSDENGFERAVTDLKEINEFIHLNHPDLPVFLLGHSMGSFFVRRFVQRYDGCVDGVLLSGTGGHPGYKGKTLVKIAEKQMKKRSKKSEGHLINRLIFQNYNKKISPKMTDFDWLSTNQNEVRKYIDDPKCGFIPTIGLFYDVLKGLDLIHLDSEVEKINKTLPFYFFSGADDPVGEHTKGIKKVIDQLKRHHLNHVDYRFYHKGRHEMLNEMNNHEVIKHLCEWINKQLYKVAKNE